MLGLVGITPFQPKFFPDLRCFSVGVGTGLAAVFSTERGFDPTHAFVMIAFGAARDRAGLQRGAQDFAQRGLGQTFGEFDFVRHFVGSELLIWGNVL